MSYSPYINRFLSPDTLVPGAANPQNLNRYSYVRNNPVRYTDPTGHMIPCEPGDICQHVPPPKPPSPPPSPDPDPDPTPDPNPNPVPTPPPAPVPADYQNTDYYQYLTLMYLNGHSTGSHTVRNGLRPLPPSPFACGWTDCALSALSILASGVITAFPEVTPLAIGAFVGDVVVTIVAVGRTNSDRAQGTISTERQWILNGTGIVGVLPIPYVGLGLSIVNGMATFSGYPP